MHMGHLGLLDSEWPLFSLGSRVQHLGVLGGNQYNLSEIHPSCTSSRALGTCPGRWSHVRPARDHAAASHRAIPWPLIAALELAKASVESTIRLGRLVMSYQGLDLDLAWQPCPAWTDRM